MSEQSRLFEAGPDPFGKMWTVQFRWLQTGISIRHADTVDVKFLVTPHNGEGVEKVIAIPHKALLTLTSKTDQPLTDPFCMRLAAAHLRHMIETAEDMDKTLVTIPVSDLDGYERNLRTAVTDVR